MSWATGKRRSSSPVTGTSMVLVRRNRSDHLKRLFRGLVARCHWSHYESVANNHVAQRETMGSGGRQRASHEHLLSVPSLFTSRTLQRGLITLAAITPMTTSCESVSKVTSF